MLGKRSQGRSVPREQIKLRRPFETLTGGAAFQPERVLTKSTLAMRAAFDYLRKEQRRRISRSPSKSRLGKSSGDDVGDDSVLDYFTELHAPMPDATEHLHARRTLATIARGMLTAEEKQIVAMKADGLSTEEIASAIGRPTKTVDTKVFRIRAKLRAEGIEI